MLATYFKRVVYYALMKVIRAKSAGFCWGVERAIKIARRLAAEGHKPVLTDGPLIHNKQMTDLLEAEGIREAGEIINGADKNILKKHHGNPAIVVRAHGIAPERRKFLKSFKSGDACIKFEYRDRRYGQPAGFDEPSDGRGKRRPAGEEIDHGVRIGDDQVDQFFLASWRFLRTSSASSADQLPSISRMAFRSRCRFFWSRR